MTEPASDARRGRLATLIVLAFLLATGTATSQPAPVPHVRLVVGHAAEPSAGDRVLADHLRVGLGLEVSWLDDEAALPAANDQPVDLYLVSESVSSSAIGDRYRDVPVPVVVFENAAWEAMALSHGYGTAFGGAPVRATPAADGLLPDPDALTALARRGADLKAAYGVVADAEILARTDDDNAYPVAFRVDTGARLHGTTAPARRAGLGIVDDGFATLDAAAWDLLIGTVAWALDRPLPQPRWQSVLVVGFEHEGGFASQPDLMVRTRLRALGMDVRLVGDGDVSRLPLTGFRLAVMSKTVDSLTVGTALRDAAIPVLFWEDNQQALPLMATIDEDLDGPTAWHAPSQWVDLVSPELDPSGRLRTGPLQLYRQPDEITYAPSGELAPGALPVAGFGDDASDGRVAAYLVPRGATLADGRPSGAPLAFFGLYDRTFRHLTPEGVALFDVLVSWLLADGPPLPSASGAP